jgi:hypothetical protein
VVSDTFDLRDFAGAHASARIPVSSAALNRFVAGALARRSSPVREVRIQPVEGDRFDVAIAVSWPFVPELHATFIVDRQPSFPASPLLVFRWSFLGLAGAIASRLLSHFEKLPPGIKLDGDQLLLDIPVLAAGSAVAPMLVHIKALELHTLDDRVVVELEVGVAE